MVVLISTIAMFCKSIIDFISNIAAKDSKGENVNKFYLLESITIVILLFIILGTGLMPVRFDWNSIYYGIIIGLFSFVSYLLYLLSLKGQNGSINITVYRLNFIISSVLAIFILNEKITFNKMIGITFCVIAILLFINTKGVAVKKDVSMLYSILACILAGGMNLVNKIALSAGVESNTLLFYRYVIVLLMTVGFYKLRKIDMKIDIKSSHTLIITSTIAGVLMLLSLNFLYYALKIGDVSVVMPIVQSCFIFASVLCFVFLKEKLSVRKVVGILFAVISIIIIGL